MHCLPLGILPLGCLYALSTLPACCALGVKRLLCLSWSRWKTFLLGILAGVYLAMSGALSYTVAGEVNDVGPLCHAWGPWDYVTLSHRSMGNLDRNALHFMPS